MKLTDRQMKALNRLIDAAQEVRSGCLLVSSNDTKADLLELSMRWENILDNALPLAYAVREEAGGERAPRLVRTNEQHAKGGGE